MHWISVYCNSCFQLSYKWLFIKERQMLFKGLKSYSWFKSFRNKKYFPVCCHRKTFIFKSVLRKHLSFGALKNSKKPKRSEEIEVSTSLWHIKMKTEWEKLNQFHAKEIRSFHSSVKDEYCQHYFPVENQIAPWPVRFCQLWRSTYLYSTLSLSLSFLLQLKSYTI